MLQNPATVNRRTDKMPALFNNPSGGTVEPMVVSRGKVDYAKEKSVSGLDSRSRGASTTFYGRACPHFSRDLDRLEHTLSEVL